MKAKEFIQTKMQNAKITNAEAVWISPDSHNFSINYLKKIARELGYHAKGRAEIIIY